jgi:hypothetical protein
MFLRVSRDQKAKKIGFFHLKVEIAKRICILRVAAWTTNKLIAVIQVTTGGAHHNIRARIYNENPSHQYIQTIIK